LIHHIALVVVVVVMEVMGTMVMDIAVGIAEVVTVGVVAVGAALRRRRTNSLLRNHGASVRRLSQR
jgi:hypothetical protein